MTVWVLESCEYHERSDVWGVHATEASGILHAKSRMEYLDSLAAYPNPSVEWRDEGVDGMHLWERVYKGQAERYPRPDCLFVSLREWPLMTEGK